MSFADAEPADNEPPAYALRTPKTAVLRHAAVVACAAVLAACSTYAGSARDFAPSALARDPGWIRVDGVPAARQETESACGAAAIAMVVAYWTAAPTAQIMREIGPIPERGLSAGRLRTFARGRRLAAYLVQATVADLEHELRNGRPVLVGLAKPQRRGVLTHYEVVVAVHPERRRVVTLDPGAGWRENTYEGFLVEWRPVRGLALVVSPRIRAKAPSPREAERSGEAEPRSEPPGESRPAGPPPAPAPPAPAR